MIKITSKNSYYFLTLLLILLFNIVLKITFLGAEPFWYDESISIKNSLLDFGHIKHISEWDNNPPFYYYCLWVWSKCFGISEFSSRFLSVFFSSVSACLLFIFVKKHFNFAIAGWSTALFTFHNFIYQYSHETRSYSLVLMLVLVSSILFFKYVEKPNYQFATLLGLVNFLLVYTHYIAGIILVIQFLFVIFSKGIFKNYYILSIVIPAVLVLVRFTQKQYLLLFSYHQSEDSFWLPKANFKSLTETLESLLGGKCIWLLMLFLLLIGSVFIFIKFKEIAANKILLYSFFSGCSVIILLFLIGIKVSLFLDRYLIFTVPFLLIIISWVIYTFNKRFQLVFLLLIVGLILNLKLNPAKPMDFKLAATIVKKISIPPHQMILLQTKDITGLFAYYYDKNVFLDQTNLTENLKKLNIHEMNDFTDLKSIDLENQTSIILCQTFEKPKDNKLIFDYFTEKKFTYASTSIVRGVKINLLRKISIY